ncbi:MAG TPA: hypothetical protein VFY06_03040 [Verrucomicrobiae bacterium]|nr:hypothetical protein [Verrucomicrobiae bacterium]
MKDYVLKEKAEPASNESVWAFDLGKGSIAATLPALSSNRYEGELMPTELANGVASFSTYPSARILKMSA